MKHTPEIKLDAIHRAIGNSISGLRNESRLQAEFQSMPDSWLQEFIHAVDHSPHPLKEWLTAHDFFATWTEGKNRSVSLARRQEYLICCLEGMKDPAGSLTLESILAYYLGQNGMD